VVLFLFVSLLSSGVGGVSRLCIFFVPYIVMRWEELLKMHYVQSI
jgi:hypothetical protein